VQVDQAALGEPLPYLDRAFDLVVCALAIHYASDRTGRGPSRQHAPRVFRR
jgi:hypothetical protein